MKIKKLFSAAIALFLWKMHVQLIFSNSFFYRNIYMVDNAT
jgi:hypothetical protein